MSTPDITAPVTAPIGWAKGRPVVFAIFLLIVVIVVIRFREGIASAISKIPVVGKWLTGIAHAGVFIVGAGLLLVGGAS